MKAFRSKSFWLLLSALLLAFLAWNAYQLLRLQKETHISAAGAILSKGEVRISIPNRSVLPFTLLPFRLEIRDKGGKHLFDAQSFSPVRIKALATTEVPLQIDLNARPVDLFKAASGVRVSGEVKARLLGITISRRISQDYAL
jgi:hypothetical protein